MRKGRIAIRYTQEQYEKACSVDLAAYLASNGYDIEKSGTEYALKSPHGVTIRDNGWYDHYAKEGGGSIQFLVRYEGIPWANAVVMLAGATPVHEKSKPTHEPPLAEKQKKEKKLFILPERAPDHRRVFSYLTKTRCIDAEIVRYCLKERHIYESFERNPNNGKAYRNCVFVGLDEQGVARNATIRGIYSCEAKPFRHDVEGSEKHIPFRLEGVSRTVYVYESPIDLLSHAAFHKQINEMPEGWRYDNRMALCGTHDGALEWFLDKRPDVERIIFCLDRDEAGLNATAALLEKYVERGYEVGCELPRNKDWNEDLQFGTYEADSHKYENAEMET